MNEPTTPRGPGLAPFFLGGAALAAVAAVLLLLVPLADCPRCRTGNFLGPFEKWDVHELGDACRVCDGRRRVPPFKKWTWEPARPKK